jgi:hypothetical protein
MRKCVFCESAASTKEDAWPRWLVRRLFSTIGVEVEGQRGDKPAKKWRLKQLAQPIKIVCAGCNNGWMSDLEGSAKTVIEPLIDSDKYDFAIEDRRNLTRWVLKTAMVFESLGDDRKAFYSQVDRDDVRRGGLPSGYHSVWVGRCVEFGGFFCRASDLSDAPDFAPREAHGYVTTLGFGPLAVQVVTVKLASASTRLSMITIPLVEGPWDEIGRNIWPSDATVMSWAPTQALRGESGLNALAERCRNGSD